MPTENERKDNKEFQEKVETKLAKKFGHAVPQIDRNRPIENNFNFIPLDREKLENPLKDFNMDEYKLWRQFNNKEERQNRQLDVKFIDEPGISDEEIRSRLEYDREALLKSSLEQIKNHPELFEGFISNDSNS